MPDIFGGPGIGHVANPFEATSSIGIMQFAVRSDFGGTFLVEPFLIQNYQFNPSERVQESYTLAETEHLYTFGRTLPRLVVTGYFLNSNTKGSTTIPTLSSAGRRTLSKDIIKIWEDMIRAKRAGQDKQPTVRVAISPLNTMFLCVPISMSLVQGIDLEALVQVSIEMLVLNELGDRVT